LRGDVSDAVTQVVFEVLSGGDASTSDAVVVAPYVHQSVLSRRTRFSIGTRLGTPGNHSTCAHSQSSAELSSVHLGCPPLKGSELLYVTGFTLSFQDRSTGPGPALSDPCHISDSIYCASEDIYPC